MIAAFLDRHLAAGVLIAEPGFTHAGAPDDAVAAAAVAQRGERVGFRPSAVPSLEPDVPAVGR